jgi:hypothetical protein
MSIVDTAILRIQALAIACDGIKAAPAYPTDDAGVLPLAIAHVGGGTATAMNKTDAKLMMDIMIDVHFDRQILRLTYQKIDTFIPEFLLRLAGDPTLATAVSTIVYPVTFSVTPTQWDNIITQMVSFTIPVKFNFLTPTVTP